MENIKSAPFSVSSSAATILTIIAIIIIIEFTLMEVEQFSEEGRHVAVPGDFISDPSRVLGPPTGLLWGQDWHLEKKILIIIIIIRK